MDSSDFVTMRPLGEFSDVLTDANIAQFLAANDWTCQVDRTFDQTWIHQESVDSSIAVVLLPRERSFVDYPKRLAEASRTIARTYGWLISELAERVAAIHADMFFIRLEQDSRDGTISLKQASELIDSVTSLVRAAATTTASPSHTHKGRRPPQVTSFMADDLRMGHTKKGSFIVTVVARLDAHPAETGQAPPDGRKEVRGDSPVSNGNPQAPTAQVLPFARRVMTTLARTLEVTRQVAGNETTVKTAADAGVSLELVESVRRMGSGSGLQAIDLSFDWADSLPPPEQVPTGPIHFDRELVVGLSSVAEQMKGDNLPRATRLTGPVLSLSRPDAEPGEVDSGTVAIGAEVDGRNRKVWATLYGTDHDWAILAYQRRIQLTLVGELFRTNRWELSPVIVDAEFLRFTLKIQDPRDSIPT